MLFEANVDKKIYDKALWSDYTVSQELLLSEIKASKTAGRLPHCSIISGIPGAGQLYISLMMAQTILCNEPNAPCGVCIHCHKVSTLNHPDLNFSFPVIGANQSSDDSQIAWKEMVMTKPYLTLLQWLESQSQENKQANITAAECRNIIDKLQLMPFESDRKVMLIWLPEFLGKEGNILLKLLEEPPGNAFIILVTEDLNNIINTIKSRAHLYRLHPVSETDFVNYFSQKFNISTELATAEYLISDKNIAASYQKFNSKNEQQEIFRIDRIRSFFQKIYKLDAYEIIKWVEEFATEGKENQRVFLMQLLHILSISMRYQSSHSVINSRGEIHEFALKLNAILTVQMIDQILQLTDDTFYYIQRNGSIKICMTDYMIQCAKIIKNKN